MFGKPDRLMLERLEQLASQLKKKQQVAPAALEEQTVRLLTGMGHGAPAAPCQ
jgi:hypothetical protein